MLDVGTYFIYFIFGKRIMTRIPQKLSRKQTNITTKIQWSWGEIEQQHAGNLDSCQQNLVEGWNQGGFWWWSWYVHQAINIFIIYIWDINIDLIMDIGYDLPGDVDHVCIFRTYSLGCSNPTYPGFVCLLQMSWFSWALDSWEKMSTVIMVVTSQHPGCLEDHPS